MTSKRTHTVITDNVEEDLDVLEFQLKNSLRKNFLPCKRSKPSDFNIVYESESGKRVTTSKKRSSKRKYLPKQVNCS